MENTEPQNAGAKAPTHIAYQVSDGDSKSYWHRIGVAWANKDGKGFNLQLQSLPLDGRITVRIASEPK